MNIGPILIAASLASTPLVGKTIWPSPHVASFNDTGPDSIAGQVQRKYMECSGVNSQFGYVPLQTMLDACYPRTPISDVVIDRYMNCVEAGMRKGYASIKLLLDDCLRSTKTSVAIEEQRAWDEFYVKERRKMLSKHAPETEETSARNTGEGRARDAECWGGKKP